LRAGHFGRGLSPAPSSGPTLNERPAARGFPATQADSPRWRLNVAHPATRGQDLPAVQGGFGCAPGDPDGESTPDTRASQDPDSPRPESRPPEQPVPRPPRLHPISKIKSCYADCTYPNNELTSRMPMYFRKPFDRPVHSGLQGRVAFHRDQISPTDIPDMPTRYQTTPNRAWPEMLRCPGV
jgi:hypothetical protein